ncbi:MAG TPA: ABC transporter substrate-binding protein [Candidatus Angelobacter sp.]|nr:ABC transporter substrate-binding protein [Candidatus Angelobacter sp.]
MKTRIRARRKCLLLAVLVFCVSCGKLPDANTIVVIIENSPPNLDPRVASDAQGQLISELIFDSLVRKDEHFNLKPAVAESWEMPDPQTYVFHLRHGIQFHDGRPLLAKDVKWTLDTVRGGTMETIKGAAYELVDRVEAPDDFTLTIHTAEPYAPLLWNLSEGAFGIVPFGSGNDFNGNPIGSGPYRLVRSVPDSEVVLERNETYWGNHPPIKRIRFNVVPDGSTRALELRKGSADIAINSLTPDTVGALQHERNLEVLRHPGTSLAYLAFNLRDPILQDVRVRQALAYAIDRGPMLHYLFRDSGRLADSVLPPEHWAFNPDVAHYPHEPAKADALLDSAGHRRGTDGVRFHLTMKISTEETSGLIAAVLQQQLRSVGIALDIRRFESATLYSDVLKGSFQLYSLRWVGYSNQDPDFFEDAFHSASFPPKRANRGRYSNPEVDRLVEEGRRTADQQRRKQIYGEVQRILARDLPYINLWYMDNVLVHSTRVQNLQLGPSADYNFLTSASLKP